MLERIPSAALYVAIMGIVALAVALAVIGGSTVIGHVAQTTDAPRPRLSGNCGPAAQGLTPDGDVVPIKVDRAGRVLWSPVTKDP